MSPSSVGIDIDILNKPGLLYSLILTYQMVFVSSESECLGSQMDSPAV